MAGILLVREIMIRAVKTVGINVNVWKAVQKMNKFDIGSIVVMDGRRPVGILTERDILRLVEQSIDPSIIKVKEVMSSPITTITSDTSIEDAARLMAKKGVKKLPVIEDDKLVGIVTATDIMRAGPKLVDLLEDLLQTRM